MLRKIFDMDNSFMRGLARITDFVLLNILFLLCCIPIVTIGASLSALYSMTLKMVKNEESYTVKGFLQAFRQNLKQGSIFGVTFTVIIVMLVVDLFFLGNADVPVMKLIKVLSMAVLIGIFILSLYIFPIIGRFQMSSKEIFRNALLISIAHLPKTLLLIAMYIPVVLMMLYSGVSMYLLRSIYLVCGFALMAYLQSIVLRKIFSEYEPKEEEEIEEMKEAYYE